MNAAPDIELPLYNAFIRLMQLEKNQSQRGIDPGSYLQLVDVLYRGYGLNSKEELLFFCKKIWLKPFHRGNAAVTEEVMEQIILDNLRIYESGFEKTEAIKSPDKPPVTEEDQDSRDTGGENPDDQNDVQDITRDKNEQLQAEAEAMKPASRPMTTSLLLNIEEEGADNSIGKVDYSNYFNDKRFKFNFTYLAVSPRFIEQTVRSLRFKVKGIGTPVFDIEGAVKELITRGTLSRMLMREEEDFVTKWTLLFDRGGSMIAFHALQDALQEAAFRGTIKNDGDLFFFRNVAKSVLFTNVQRTRSVPFIQMAHGPLRNILIVSDAGAARGSYSEDRVRDTLNMIYELRKHRVAWLNPMPKKRWENSSAEAIAEFVNMFEPGDDYSDNLGNIVRLFKSKIITPTVI